jgi:uncharacterized protein (DUF169 family)
VSAEDISCPLAKTSFGFAPLTELYTSGQLACGMYTESAEAGARSEAATRKLTEGVQVLAGRLGGGAGFSPGAVVIYGNSAQVLGLVVGTLWRRGCSLTSSIRGRVDCSDEVIATTLTGDYQVILPCYGDRVLGQTQDHEMAFSLPGLKIDELVNRLEGTQKGGICYPIPRFCATRRSILNTTTNSRKSGPPYPANRKPEETIRLSPKLDRALWRNGGR